MRDRILRAADAAGREPSEITCVYNVPIPDLRDVDAAIEQLLGYIRLGFTSLNFMPDGPDPRAQTERLGLDVLPELRTEINRRSEVAR
ncbi:hypothetical protein ACGFNU_32300 [Spirillospora sp. NPDC048911]|uniref:hypothetical protein n=1 Tax=Spirillospora sp. NPDC048911 TaxID=3364527 RepID=UPI00371B5F88